MNVPSFRHILVLKSRRTGSRIVAATDTPANNSTLTASPDSTSTGTHTPISNPILADGLASRFFRSLAIYLQSVVAFAVITGAALLTACRTERSQDATPTAPSVDVPASPITMRDVTDDVHLGFQHTDGGSGELYIVESVCCGMALLDYDQDGMLDIYFLNGAPLRGASTTTPPKNGLYRNLGNWQFAEMSEAAGIADTGYGLGVAAGDYDNDGDIDLYLNNYGPNVLYRNNGDGTFSDVSESAAVSAGNLVGAGVCFLDYDRDGRLDLYVSNYVDFTYDNHVPCSVNGYPAYAGPRYYNPVPDILYHNNGDGTFTDVSQTSGIAAFAGSGMGIISADYDNDGDTDVFVCNDSRTNFLFQNQGDGTFSEVATVAGTSVNYYGDANASMGVDCGDYNNDGLLDFFMTNYAAELPVLYQNVGRGFLDDVTRLTGAGLGALPHVTWGLGFADFDNDCDLDLYVACGHLDSNVELRDDTAAYRARNILLANQGDGTFENITEIAGDGMRPCESSRGLGLGDLDNDGLVDVVVLNSRARSTIAQNVTDNPYHWLQIELRGTTSNRHGIGARVQLASESTTQVREVHSGRGYQSHFGLQLHFGLANDTRAKLIEVRWPSGLTESFADIPVDRRILLIEGTGTRRAPRNRANGI
jgi:hypothetical protein